MWISGPFRRIEQAQNALKARNAFDEFQTSVKAFIRSNQYYLVLSVCKNTLKTHTEYLHQPEEQWNSNVTLETKTDNGQMQGHFHNNRPVLTSFAVT